MIYTLQSEPKLHICVHGVLPSNEFEEVIAKQSDMLTCSSNSNLICPNRGVQSTLYDADFAPELKGSTHSDLREWNPI